MNRLSLYFFICFLSAFGCFQVFAETLIVKTRAPENKLAMFQYRVPRGYDANRGETYRVLVIFGGRNTDGKADVSGRMGVLPKMSKADLRLLRNTIFARRSCFSMVILPEVSARTCFPPGDRSSPVPGCHTPAVYSMSRQPECAPWPDL